MLQSIPAELLSKKLAALLLLFGFLVLLTIIAVVAWALWGAPIAEILGIGGGSGTAATGTHLISQASADKSPNYNPPKGLG